ncbi:hypothetical protein LEP1GSC085_2312 [Leptospira interrogans str. L0996]|nr:hypothetical protein LEP1GSC085_2312 [Leptospira interrogans str. L0996]
MDLNVKDKFQSGFSSIDNLSRNLPPHRIQRGKEGAAFDDQAKELDRKTLFLEDLERDYNRRRRSIRYSDPDLSFTRESSSNLEIDRYEREKPKDGLLPESNIPEGKDPLREKERRCRKDD